MPQSPKSPKRSGSASSMLQSPKRFDSGSSMQDSEVPDIASDGPRSPTEDSRLRSSISSSTLGVVEELKTFRQFLKPRYATPGEAYDSLKGGFSNVLDEKTFMVRMEEL